METILKAVREGIAACNGIGGETAGTVFQLCLAPAAERTRLVDQAFASPSPEPSLLQALAYLFSAREPGRSLEIVRRLPAEGRDGLCLRLVRFRWIDPKAALPIPGCIADPALREEALLWQNLGGTCEEDWLHSLAALAALRPLDPSAPGHHPFLNRLWTCDSSRSRHMLAGAFPHALRGGGRIRGEATLRLWLHAHLTPALGTEKPQAHERDRDAAAALKISLVLSP